MNVYSLQDQAKTNTEIEMCVCQCCLVVPVGPDLVQLSTPSRIQAMESVGQASKPWWPLGHGVNGCKGSRVRVQTRAQASRPGPDLDPEEFCILQCTSGLSFSSI